MVRPPIITPSAIWAISAMVTKDHRLDLRFLPSLACRLVDQEIVKFPSTLDRSNKPPWLCPTACPSLTRPTAILWRDLPSFQCTSTASNNPCAANHPHPLQLLLKFGTMLMKGFVNPLSQVHECFDG